MKFKQLPMGILLAGLLLAAGLFGLVGVDNAQPVEAAPPAAVTPAAVTVYNAEVLAASATSNAIDLSEYTSADWQVTIVQGTSVNTATVALNKSINGYNWATAATLLSGSGSSTTVVTNSTIVGRYGQIQVTLTNTNPVTLTVLGYKRP